MTNGWNHLDKDAMATNSDPIVGGIIDNEIVSGKWFVIPNNDAIAQADGFSTKADAFAYLDARVAELPGTESQFDVVITYDTALSSPREAIELAVTVISDRLGAYVEIFKDHNDTAVLEGQILDEKTDPKSNETNDFQFTMVDPEGSFESCNVVFSYSTIATSPNEALSMALDAIDNHNGAYVEVFASGNEQSIFEGEVAALFEAAPALRV
jgi:hypothetical protein